MVDLKLKDREPDNWLSRSSGGGALFAREVLPFLGFFESLQVPAFLMTCEDIGS